MLDIKKDVLLAPYTTFKIGGPAKYFAEACDAEEILELCNWAKKKSLLVFVLGGGSNVLISDKGFDGLVIKIENCKLKIENSSAKAEAGVPLAKLVMEAANAGLTGLEWAIGIPGTVGGAINGNAGAFGRATSEAAEEVEVFDILEHSVKTFKKEDCKFSYRNSFFKRNSDLIILSATFHLKKGDKEHIQKAIKDFTRQRIESNPVGFSAGCFFRNPDRKEIASKFEAGKFPELEQFQTKPKISAGFLVEQVGLKGQGIGGAVSSEKHANFILNKGGATAQDVISFTNLIKEKIRERYGFELEDEVVII